MKKYSKQELSWILYDGGNSAYSLTITTSLFPVFFAMVSINHGMSIGYFNSLASILVALLSPILGTIADYKDYKKRFFLFFSFLGVITTASLAIVPDEKWFLLGIIYFATAVSFAGANIFYDAFLVDITTEDRMDIISTRGYAYGYIISVIPFVIALMSVYLGGMDKTIGFKIGFFIVAIWWGLFTIPLLKNVKQIHYVEKQDKIIKNSFERLGRTFINIKKYKKVIIFLIAYFFYIDGVGTIIKMCVPYSIAVLKLDSSNVFLLLAILLVINIIAFPCAVIYGNLSKKFGTEKMLIVAVITYMIAVFFAYFMYSTWHVFVLGLLIGSAQGGVQALSRSYFAKMIPKNNANEFFGFYNIFGKFAAILGPALMAFVSDTTSNIRLSILTVLPLFFIGIIFLVLASKMKGEINEKNR